MQQLALRVGVLACLLAASLPGQIKPATSKKAQNLPQSKPVSKSALDKAAFESYLRHVNRWGKQIQLTIVDPKPSEVLPGYKDILVKATDGTRSGEMLYHVSENGQRIVRGEVYNINENPFKR